MYKTKEIRWFTQQENKRITNWFAGQGLHFNTINSRNDYYLIALDHAYIAPKIREGKIEIKYRMGPPTQYSLTPNARGYFENYTKWSFALHSEDRLSTEIIKTEYSTEWMKVQKERLGVKLTKESNENQKIYNIKDRIDTGCQIEYTRIKVMQEIWYSFNLEWFGEEFIDPGTYPIPEIIGDNIFRLKDSMGYGQFLKMLLNLNYS